MMNLRAYTLNCKNGLKPTIKNELLHSAFKVRFQVYCEEMGVVSESPEREVYDEYDFIEASSIFLVFDDSRPVGTMRLTKYSEEHRLSIFKNFEEELNNGLYIHDRIEAGRQFAEVSRFTVLKDYRKGRRYVQSVLTCMLHDRCLVDGVTDIVIVANPCQSKLYESAGFKVFGVRRDSLTGIESPAMHAEVNGDFGRFIKYLESILKRRYPVQLFNQSGRIRQEVVDL